MSHIPAVLSRSPGRPRPIVCVWPGEEAPRGAGAISQTVASRNSGSYFHNGIHSSLLMEVIKALFPLCKVTLYIKYQIMGINTWQEVVREVAATRETARSDIRSCFARSRLKAADYLFSILDQRCKRNISTSENIKTNVFLHINATTYMMF